MEREYPKISFVSPVYQGENTLNKLVLEIQKVMQRIGEPFEIILVDDRSPDKSWEVMKNIALEYTEVKSIRLSRNFGQHPAIMAGLSLAIGEWVVVMDCDLQDQPKEVVKLYNKAKEGFDVVLAKRKNRQDGILKRTSSLIFSKIYGYFTDTTYDNEVANFGIYHKKVVKSIIKISDSIKFFPLFVKFVGYNATSIIVEHTRRENGNSSYSITKLISLAFNSIISFSNKPLKLFVKFGMVMSLVSFIVGLTIIFKYYRGEISVLGYSSLMVSIWFLSGIIITAIGVTGIYVGKIFDQTKNRPVFIIDEIK